MVPATTPTGEESGPADPGRIPVVAAVVRRGEAFLVARRPDSKRHGGLWEFPGGKVLEGESDRQALERELREELDVTLLAVGEAVFEARDPGTPFVVRFRSAEIGGEPRAREHLEVRWIPRRELPALALAPSDARFVAEGLGVGGS